MATSRQLVGLKPFFLTHLQQSREIAFDCVKFVRKNGKPFNTAELKLLTITQRDLRR